MSEKLEKPPNHWPHRERQTASIAHDSGRDVFILYTLDDEGVHWGIIAGRGNPTPGDASCLIEQLATHEDLPKVLVVNHAGIWKSPEFVDACREEGVQIETRRLPPTPSRSRKLKPEPTAFFLREEEGIDATMLILQAGYGSRSRFTSCREATAANWIHFLSALDFKITHLIWPPTDALKSPEFRKWCEDFGVRGVLVDPFSNAESIVLNPTQVSSGPK